MPIYEYRCDGCQAVFEVFQKVSDPAPSAHSCGSAAVHRILSNTSFVLKGTGWYATDYADKSKKTGDSDSGKSQKKAESSDGAGAQGQAGDSSQSGAAAGQGASKSPAEKPKGAAAKPSDKGSAPT